MCFVLVCSVLFYGINHIISLICLIIYGSSGYDGKFS